MDRLVRAFPLLPGKRQAFDAFTEEIRRRKGEVAQFYDGYGVARESWHLQHTSAGDLIICCTDIQDLRPMSHSVRLAFLGLEPKGSAMPLR